MTEFSRLTRGLRTGIDTDTAHGAVVPPMYLSSNFSFEGLGMGRTYDYSRSGNPTRDQLADALATLEGGFGAVVTSSGMSAVTLVALALGSGGTIVIPHDCYGGTWRLFTHLAARGLIRLETIDFTDTAQLAGLGDLHPDVVWLETPSNPLLRITDIAEAARVAHAAGALVVADNTFCSPLLQRPLALGADVVVHSTTKYINGHSDVVGGAVVAGSEELQEKLAFWANTLGVTGAPFDSYLTLRGVRTLSARMRVHLENARAVVDLLTSHPAVSAVHYPGLPDHPGHELASRQQEDFGAIVSFELAGGRDAVARAVQGLRCFTLAESLGGIESLVAHPASMTHASMTPEAQEQAGITEGLLRLSVGIEGATDLVNDLREALDRSAADGNQP